MSRPYNISLRHKPAVILMYGSGCDIIVEGKRKPFCDDCEKCPLPDCVAGVAGGFKYRFRLNRGEVKNEPNKD